MSKSKTKSKTDHKSISTISSIVAPPPKVPPPTLANTFKPFDQQNIAEQFKSKTGTAETIMETKRMLSNGARLVSTRRPMTPREPKRELYGKVLLADRPPSAFSLRYLQMENQPKILPPIESPIRTSKLNNTQKSIGGSFTVNDTVNAKATKLTSLRSSSSFNEAPAKSLESNTPGTVLNAMSPQASVDSENAGVSPMENILEVDEQIAMNEPSKESSDRISSSQRLLLMRGNDLLAQSSTETLLEMLTSHSGIKECSEETTLHINGILTELYSRVKNVKDDRRNAVLCALYGLVECVSPKILLSVARVVLALRVTGSNLTGACKLVFKVARNERNDNLFVNIDVPELLIDGLGRASPIDEQEACIYGYGSVRFLANAVVSPMATSAGKHSASVTNNSAKKHKTLACRLTEHGAIPLMTLHLQILNAAGAASKLQSSSLHALYQLIGALRVISKIFLTDQNLNIQGLSSLNNNKCRSASTVNVSIANSPEDLSLPSSPENFNSQIVFVGPHLIRAAEICISEIEIQSNIIRTLSILSEDEKCCDAIAEMSPRLGILLGTIFDARLQYEETHSIENDKALGVLNRIGYILGNLMANCDSARFAFYSNDVAMEYLVRCLEFYANDMGKLKRERRNSKAKVTKGEDTANGDDMGDQHNDTAIDVVIKLTRVIANASVNGDVGYSLANFPQLGTILSNILEMINKFKSHMSVELDELLLASLGAIHNLSFYQDSEEKHSTNGSMVQKTASISATLCKIYQWTPESVRAEIARVLGNLTRSTEARSAVFSAGGLQFLLKNLTSNDFDLVGTSCGILVNMLSDRDRRAPFKKLKGPCLLRKVLQRSAKNRDWLLALIACQALWNYIIDSGNVILDLGEDEANHISCEILEYLDEELCENGAPNEEWEEFAIVAADLLERIQTSMSSRHSPFSSIFDDT